MTTAEVDNMIKVQSVNSVFYPHNYGFLISSVLSLFLASFTQFLTWTWCSVICISHTCCHGNTLVLLVFFQVFPHSSVLPSEDLNFSNFVFMETLLSFSGFLYTALFCCQMIQIFPILLSWRHICCAWLLNWLCNKKSLLVRFVFR